LDKEKEREREREREPLENRRFCCGQFRVWRMFGFVINYLEASMRRKNTIHKYNIGT
jgi:hypothetical protein